MNIFLAERTHLVLACRHHESPFNNFFLHRCSCRARGSACDPLVFRCGEGCVNREPRDGPADRGDGDNDGDDVNDDVNDDIDDVNDSDGADDADAYEAEMAPEMEPEEVEPEELFDEAF